MHHLASSYGSVFEHCSTNRLSRQALLPFKLPCLEAARSSEANEFAAVSFYIQSSLGKHRYGTLIEHQYLASHMHRGFRGRASPKPIHASSIARWPQ